MGQDHRLGCLHRYPTPPICIHLHLNSYTSPVTTVTNRSGNYDCNIYTGPWNATGVDLLNHFALLDKDMGTPLHFCTSSSFCTAGTQLCMANCALSKRQQQDRLCVCVQRQVWGRSWALLVGWWSLRSSLAASLWTPEKKWGLPSQVSLATGT